jgi:hypothetical protein
VGKKRPSLNKHRLACEAYHLVPFSAGVTNVCVCVCVCVWSCTSIPIHLQDIVHTKHNALSYMGQSFSVV